MDLAEFARRLAGLQWRFTVDGVGPSLAALGCTPLRQDGEERVGTLAGLRLVARPGMLANTVESLALEIERSQPFEDLDESARDAASDRFERRFLQLARSLRGGFGAPAWLGPVDGPTWCAWCDRVALWARPGLWLMLQLRQDDSELPLELQLVWAPPGRFQVVLGNYEIPDDPPTPGAPPAAPSKSLQQILQERTIAAGVAASEGRIEHAIAEFRAVLAQAPFYASAWHDLGFALLLSQRPAEALDCLERALANDGSLLGSVVEKRIQALSALGQLRENYERLAARANANQLDARSCYEFAFMLQRQGHADFARNLLKRFVQLAGESYAHDGQRIAAWLAKPA